LLRYGKLGYGGRGGIFWVGMLTPPNGFNINRPGMETWATVTEDEFVGRVSIPAGRDQMEIGQK